MDPPLEELLYKARIEYQCLNYTTAFRIFKGLATQGIPEARGMIGCMYNFGQGIPKDIEKANVWYRLAAEEGDCVAQYNLSHNYHYGLGIMQSNSLAFKWCQRSAEQGYIPAQNDLGCHYESGEGVLRDYVLAYKWIYLAWSRYDLFPPPENREFFSKMTPAQIAEGQRLAEEWKPKAER